MPTFLSDPPDSLYIAIFVLMLAGVGIWVRYRNRKTMILAGAGIALLVGLFLIDKLFESPREIVIRVSAEIQEDFNSGDWNRFEKHISENFEHNGKKKQDLKGPLEDAKNYQAKLAMWSFNRDDIQVDGNTVTVGFDAKPEGPKSEAFHRYVRGRFTKGPNGRWQLVGFTTYKVLNHAEAEDLYGGW
jgi:hypothetical protein